jgi:hypothetical protein
MDDHGFESRQKENVLLFFIISVPSNFQPNLLLMGTGISVLGVKRPGREADHLDLVPRLRITEAIPPLPYKL